MQYLQIMTHTSLLEFEEIFMELTSIKQSIAYQVLILDKEWNIEDKIVRHESCFRNTYGEPGHQI